MSQAPDTDRSTALTDPGLRLSLITQLTAYCPACGYSLDGRSVHLLSSGRPMYHGDTTVGTVCVICFRSDLHRCLAAVDMLFHPTISPHVEQIHGVNFYCPTDPELRGYNVHTVYEHLMHNRDLPTIPHVNISAPIEQRPHEPTLFDPPSHPLTDSLEAYDPPCPADCQ